MFAVLSIRSPIALPGISPPSHFVFALAARRSGYVALQRQRRQSTEEVVGAEFDVGICRQSQIGQTSQQRRDSDLCFEPRQRRAGTLVWADAERQVLVVLALDVEFVGRLKPLPVAIGCAQHLLDEVTLTDRHTAKFDV